MCAVLRLPIVTRRHLQTFLTECLACGDAYQRLPDLVPGLQDGLVILDWSTNAYHLIDLGQSRPSGTFTNHYRRGLDRGIDLSVVASVAGWATVVRVIIA